MPIDPPGLPAVRAWAILPMCARRALSRVDREEAAGLPIGVQVAARPWREDLVLAVMGGIESSRSAYG